MPARQLVFFFIAGNHIFSLQLKHLICIICTLQCDDRYDNLVSLLERFNALFMHSKKIILRKNKKILEKATHKEEEKARFTRTQITDCKTFNLIMIVNEYAIISEGIQL